MTNLQVVTWPVEKLIPYARNARTHSDDQVAQIAASIAEFGWTNPILAGADGIVIAGHARLLAARKLRMTEVPVIVLDHLTESQRRALVLADNRLALNAGWDEEMLRVELVALEEEGFNLDVVGFTEDVRPERALSRSQIGVAALRPLLILVGAPRSATDRLTICTALSSCRGSRSITRFRNSIAHTKQASALQSRPYSSSVAE